MTEKTGRVERGDNVRRYWEDLVRGGLHRRPHRAVGYRWVEVRPTLASAWCNQRTPR